MFMAVFFCFVGCPLMDGVRSSEVLNFRVMSHSDTLREIYKRRISLRFSPFLDDMKTNLLQAAFRSMVLELESEEVGGGFLLIVEGLWVALATFVCIWLIFCTIEKSSNYAKEFRVQKF